MKASFTKIYENNNEDHRLKQCYFVGNLPQSFPKPQKLEPKVSFDDNGRDHNMYLNQIWYTALVPDCHRATPWQMHLPRKSTMVLVVILAAYTLV